jgi:hypothetical protein
VRCAELHAFAAKFSPTVEQTVEEIEVTGFQELRAATP